MPFLSALPQRLDGILLSPNLSEMFEDTLDVSVQERNHSVCEGHACSGLRRLGAAFRRHAHFDFKILKLVLCPTCRLKTLCRNQCSKTGL